MNNNSEEVSVLINNIIEGIFERKGEQLVKLDMRSLNNAVCDYFIICHAHTKTQVDALCDSVELSVKKDTGERPHHKEGLDNCHWVLLDYGNVVVHIFQEEFRNFYNLEALWADAVIEKLEDKLGGKND